MTDESTYKLAFSMIRGMNILMAREILNRFGSEEQFFRTSAVSLASGMGQNLKIFDNAYRAEVLAKAERECEFIERNGITPIYFSDANYPARLLEADDAPLMLQVFGEANLNASHIMAVVGTRHATPYGLEFTEKLIAEIAQKVAQPVTIISGLAFGIDICAHRAAMRHGLPTIAVLAHPLNTIYPAVHRSAAGDIVKLGGALITEYTSDMPIHKGNFVARNRIVAAMCDCLLVSESAEKGGALITANLAADYHRDVMALPGRTSDRYSRGCNKLIYNNVASLVQSADDVINLMQWPRKESIPLQPTLFPEMSELDKVIYNYIEAHSEAMINDISVNTGVAIGRLSAALIDMEFRGLIIKYPGGKYRLGAP